MAPSASSHTNVAPSDVGLCGSELCWGWGGEGGTEEVPVGSSVEYMSGGEQWDETSDELAQCIEDLWEERGSLSALDAWAGEATGWDKDRGESLEEGLGTGVPLGAYAEERLDTVSCFRLRGLVVRPRGLFAW